MLCQYPVILGKDRVVSCGQCTMCRINKRREWTHRLMLETNLWSDNSFVTLTYSDDNLPAGGSLVPKDMQLFLKRLRKRYPRPIRFFGVGEYGTQTFRPHYHLALFNFTNCLRDRTKVSKNGCCQVCDLVQDTWKLGQVFLGSLTPESAQYICGYVVKKMTKIDDERLNGRHPEFTRQSRKPGIGAFAAHEVASVMLQHGIEEVPDVLQHGKKKLPLGHYMRKKIEEYSGAKRLPTKSAVDQKLQDVQRATFEDATIPSFAKSFVASARIAKLKENKTKQIATKVTKRLKNQSL